MKRPSEQWREGFRTHRSRHQNPYQKGTQEHADWLNGWETKYYKEKLL